MKATRTRPDLMALEATALQQGGYFDRKEAWSYGLSDRLLHYHVKTGRFERCFPGVYRVGRAPIAQHDDLLQAHVWSNYRGVISHVSALSLYHLSDVMPSRIHLTVPLDFGRSGAPFVLHRSTLPTSDVTEYDGIPVTTPARSVVDAASTGLDPEQVVKAVQQGLERALFSDDQVRAVAERPRYRNRRVTLPLIEEALRRAET